MIRAFVITICLMAAFSLHCYAQNTDAPKKSPLVIQKQKKRAVLRGKLSSVQGKIHEVRVKIHEKEKEKHTVIGQLTATEQKLEKTQTVLEANTIKLSNAKSDLSRTIKRLDRTKRQLKRRKDLLERRIVDMYEGDDLGYINVILGSKDMWSFLTRAYYLKQILRNDSELISQIDSDKKLIEKDQLRQKRRVAEVLTIQVSLVEQKNEVASLVTDKKMQLERIEHSKDLYEKAEDELLATSREIEASIRRIQSSASGKKGTSMVFRGGLSLPVSGPISSRFGYRVHPITRVYKLHTGVDIRARRGTPIHASADGVVILSGWYGAYGNAVVVDHGSRISTLYGHCSRLAVRNGQSVKRGQIVGYVGSTGLSTGPHCHFEKRVNGTPVNPL